MTVNFDIVSVFQTNYCCLSFSQFLERTNDLKLKASCKVSQEIWNLLIIIVVAVLGNRWQHSFLFIWQCIVDVCHGAC